MRFGGEISGLLGIIKRFQQHKISPVKMIFFQTMADIFGILYNLMDHPLYFIKVGFIKSWTPAQISKWDWYTDLMWFI